MSVFKSFFIEKLHSSGERSNANPNAAFFSSSFAILSNVTFSSLFLDLIFSKYLLVSLFNNSHTFLISFNISSVIFNLTHPFPYLYNFLFPSFIILVKIKLS